MVLLDHGPESVAGLSSRQFPLKAPPRQAHARNRGLAAKNTIWPPRSNVWLRATEPAPRAKRPTSVCTLGTPVVQIGIASAFTAWRGPTSGNPNESPRPYMQPTDLKAIARDAALRGDTKTLLHTLDLLERLLPIAAFMDFCTELDELRLQGEPPRPH